MEYLIRKGLSLKYKLINNLSGLFCSMLIPFFLTSKLQISNAIVVKLFSLYSFKFVQQEQEISNKGNMGCGNKE